MEIDMELKPDKITFTHTAYSWRGEPEKIVSHVTTAQTHSEIIEDFEMFLRGCGFVFPPNARIALIEDDLV